jgi:MYND finger
MKLNPFPVVGTDRILRPWSIHRLNLSRLPTLDLKATKVNEWLNPHVGSMMSSRERSLRKKHKEDALMFIKDTLHTILVRSSGIQGGRARRLFALQDHTTRDCDTILFINDLKFDLHSHTIICDGYVLPLTPDLLLKIESVFAKLVVNGDMVNVAMMEGEMQTWKQLLPAFVERCRSWNHEENCEYKSQGKIPLTQIMEVDPLCSCGRGKDVEGMSKAALWRDFAPYVTRVALSPLFAVSYLETVGRDPAAYRCSLCRGKGKPKLMTCSDCKKVRYCSRECQKKDWKTHKKRCKP